MDNTTRRAAAHASSAALTRVAAGIAIALSTLALAACGGGGGGDSSGVAAPQGGSNSGGDAGNGGNSNGNGNGSGGSNWSPAVVDALKISADSFLFTPSTAMADATNLRTAVGGDVFAAWDPTDPVPTLAPGMKVMFFGSATGCTGGQGPVAPGTDAAFALPLSRTGATAAGTATRWSPSANMDGCDAGIRGALGPAMVQMNADDAQGSVAMYTSATPDGGGFLRPYPTAGQNGAGANAGITGSFVAFRQAWQAADPVQPFLATSGSGVARIVSTQSVQGQAVATNGGTPGANQVKQQIAVSFINTECARTGSSPQRPCQLQYLFNTAIYRTDVTDWSTQAWFRGGNVWFDPAQGGIPIVDGPVPAAGVTMTSMQEGTPLFTSQGGATHHDAFAGENFDLRISFDQLQSVLRLVVARQQGISTSAVSDAQMVATWGTRWNDPAAWALLTADVGQEVYNPYADRSAYIGGSFSRLYVGRQAS